MWKKIKNFFFELLFPKFCFICKKEGNYLCEDCQSILEISNFHHKYSSQDLDDLYFALDYQKPIVKKIIHNFKYEPLVKELANPLASLIINHFQLIDNEINFSEFYLVPVPLTKKRLRWRGFNQAEEIAKKLSDFWKIPLISSCLIKEEETLPQVELTEEERKENIRGVFKIKNKGLIENKKIFLIDDVYTTGSTMKECAKLLKMAGVKKVLGITMTRG